MFTSIKKIDLKPRDWEVVDLGRLMGKKLGMGNQAEVYDSAL